MKKIRQGMFETNSSSVHSIVISMGDCTDKLSPVDGRVEIVTGEFEWEVRTFRSPAVKASYCLTYAKAVGDIGKEQMLREVVQEHTGAQQVHFVRSGRPGDYGEWGHIDHQSMPPEHDVCGEAFASKKTLRQFIFNPESTLHTDNDNHE